MLSDLTKYWYFLTILKEKFRLLWRREFVCFLFMNYYRTLELSRPKWGYLDSGIWNFFSCTIWNPRFQNPANDCNPESKFHWLGVRNPVYIIHGIRSPRFHDLSYVILITGVLDCQFHPTQPWIFTAGADHLIRLYTWHTLPVLWPSRQHDGLVLCKLLSPGPGDELVQILRLLAVT